MCGWFSEEAARASRSKRSGAWTSCESSGGRKLERDLTREPDVLGPVDHAHPAFAELFEQAVVRDRLADRHAGHGVIVGLGAAKVNAVAGA